MLLQERWLLPFELQSLNNIHPEFFSYGLSAVDMTVDILIGRPHGGTAVLYRKLLADRVKIVDSKDSRITGLQFCTNLGPLLLLNVYMPTNYADIHSLESYMECIGVGAGGMGGIGPPLSGLGGIIPPLLPTCL